MEEFIPCIRIDEDVGPILSNDSEFPGAITGLSVPKTYRTAVSGMPVIERPQPPDIWAKVEYKWHWNYVRRFDVSVRHTYRLFDLSLDIFNVVSCGYASGLVDFMVHPRH